MSIRKLVDLIREDEGGLHGGKTRSGKTIHAPHPHLGNHQHPEHKKRLAAHVAKHHGFSNADHHEAARHHMNQFYQTGHQAHLQAAGAHHAAAQGR